MAVSSSLIPDLIRRYIAWRKGSELRLDAVLRYFTLAGTDHPDHATQA